jgi:hypothetical protein
MIDARLPKTTGSKQAGRFQPGRSGNPAGRPKGARHAALVALDRIGAEGAAEVMKSVVDAAKAGDMRAAELLLRRLWPERKGRPVIFPLPHMNSAADAVAAVGMVAQAVACGDLSPEEGLAVAGLVELHRRALETLELEARITALEAGSDAQS